MTLVNLLVILAVLLSARALRIIVFHMAGLEEEGEGMAMLANSRKHFGRPSFRMSSNNGKVTIVVGEDLPMDQRVQNSIADWQDYKEKSLRWKPLRAVIYASVIWGLVFYFGGS